MEERCPRCGASEIQVEQDSATGTMWRSYSCGRCGWSEDVNEGTAMWKALHDHNEAQEAEEARILGEGAADPATSESSPSESSPPEPEPQLRSALARHAWRGLATLALVVVAAGVFMLFRSMG